MDFDLSPPALFARSVHPSHPTLGPQENRGPARRRSVRLQGLGRAAARGTLALLIAVPGFAILAIRERNLLWIVWSMISLWAALDARNVAAFAFRARRRRAVRGILGLAVCNLAISLWLMFGPIAPLLLARFK